IFCGVSATLNNSRVARLTPASVACADNTTATRSVKGLRCSSSPLGSGFAFRKRSNASRTSSGVQGRGVLGCAVLGFDALDLGAFFFAWRAETAFAFFFGSDRTEALLARWARMIFAMNRIY